MSKNAVGERASAMAWTLSFARHGVHARAAADQAA